MPKPIEKGGIVTGFDQIAEHLTNNGVNVPLTGQDYHYTAQDIVDAIMSIEKAPTSLSANCYAWQKSASGLGHIYAAAEVRVNGVTIADVMDFKPNGTTNCTASGTFTLNADGTITV